MKRQLECCCCGSDAGQWEQHWNRDTGYGICPSCAARQAAKLTADEMHSYYGVAGVNYEPPPMEDKSLKERPEPPGCRCSMWERPSVKGEMMRGIDDCPWHGFGTVGVSHVRVGAREYSIKCARREVLDRRRNGIDFDVEQVVLLRWQAEQQDHHLMWVLAHSWSNGGRSNYTPASLQFESRPQTSSLYTPKTIVDRERLTALLLARNAEKISQAVNLPIKVIETWANIFTPDNTYYLIDESQPPGEQEEQPEDQQR